MSVSATGRPAGRRLAAVPDKAAAAVFFAGQAPAPEARQPRVRLRPLARLDVEQAREFVMGLDAAVGGADLPRAMYLLGVLEGHAQSLLDVLDTVAEVD